jgi:hypothetical protein
MITAELQGKIGNLMFQIAAIEYMGHQIGVDTAYPQVDQNIQDIKKPQACTSEYDVEKYFGMFKNFDWHKNLDRDCRYLRFIEVPFEYRPIRPQDLNKYKGYFQSELYFPDRDFVLNLFQPAEYIEERLLEYRDILDYHKCAIHVRRGDYVKLNNVYRVLDMNYYNGAMQVMDTFGVNEYLVFSNDIAWCKENFKGDQFTFIQDDNLVELFLMGKCAHNITSNSAFSWWGGYLNTNPGRVVIAPEKWFSSASYKDKDIVPKTWFKL